MRLLTALICCTLFLISGCDENLFEKLRKEDIIDGGLSYEFEQLQKLGIQGYSIDSNNNVIFYVDEPNEEKRTNIESGLINIFGQKIEFSLEDANRFKIKFSSPQPISP